MLTIAQIFANDGWGCLHDVAVEIDGKPRTESQVRFLFNALPENIRNIAHQWGMETEFGDESMVWLKKNPTVLAASLTDPAAFILKPGLYGLYENTQLSRWAEIIEQLIVEHGPDAIFGRYSCLMSWDSSSRFMAWASRLVA